MVAPEEENVVDESESEVLMGSRALSSRAVQYTSCHTVTLGTRDFASSMSQGPYIWTWTWRDMGIINISLRILKTSSKS